MSAILVLAPQHHECSIAEKRLGREPYANNQIMDADQMGIKIASLLCNSTDLMIDPSRMEASLPLDQAIAEIDKAIADSVPTLAPTNTKQHFRDGMARLGAAVNVVTTNGPAGRAGFTASAVCSVTDTPPTLLVCLNRSASVYETFKANGVLCVNTLATGHETISQLFGGKTPMDERFAAGSWTTLATGSPVLEDAVAAFDCRVDEIVESGTHDVLFCSVQAIEINTNRDGLVYFARRYHGLSAA